MNDNRKFIALRCDLDLKFRCLLSLNKYKTIKRTVLGIQFPCALSLVEDTNAMDLKITLKLTGLKVFQMKILFGMV